VVDDELFFDPGPGPGPSGPALSRQASAASSRGGGGGGGSQGQQRDLAEFTLRLRRPGSKEYEGVDTSLEVSLNTLYFFCNRPTVAALTGLGADVSAAVAAASLGDDGGDGGGATAGEQLAAIDAGAMQAQGGGGVEKVALLGGGGGGGDGRGRTMFALTVTLRTLEVALNYEGVGAGACSQACVTDFSFALGVAPDGGMEITSALGNITAVSCPCVSRRAVGCRAPPKTPPAAAQPSSRRARRAPAQPACA
jgi:hypothetical protein